MTRIHDIRPATLADAAAIAVVQVAAWNVAYKEILPLALVSRMTVPDRTGSWQRIITALDESGQGGVLVAEAGGMIEGFASYGAQREAELGADYSGELTALYLSPEVWRQGIGSGLIRAAARGLAGLGHRAMSVWVLSDNAPARAFYEYHGGVLVSERAGQGEGVSEVAYGWPDIALIAAIGTEQG